MFEIVLVVGIFSTIGAIYTYPLVLHLSTSLPHGYFTHPRSIDMPPLNSDTLQTYFSFWNFKDSVLRLASPYDDRYEFALSGGYQSNMWGFPLVVIYAPLSLLWGDLAAYNLIVLATFPMAALAMYSLARSVVGSNLGAVVAAVVWACNPWRVSKMVGGHVFGFLFFFPPTFLFLFEQGLRRRSLGYMAAAGITLALLGMSLGSYLIFYFALMLMFYIPVRGALFLGDPANGVSVRQRAILLARVAWPVALGGLFLAVYVYVVFYLPSVVQTYGAARPISEIAGYSATLRSFEDRINLNPEQYLYLGIAWLALPLALLLLIFHRSGHPRNSNPSSRSQPRRVQAPKLPAGEGTGHSKRLLPGLLLLGALAGVVLSLGPNFDAATGIPFYHAFYHIPFVAGSRVPTHAFMITVLCLSLLAALVVTECFRSLAFLAHTRLARWGGPIVAGGVLLAFFLNLWVAHGMWLYSDISRLQRDPVLMTLRDESPPKRAMFIPAQVYGTSSVEFYATIDQTPAVNGYSPLMPNDWISFAQGVDSLNFGGQITAEMYATFKKDGITDVVIDREMLAAEHLAPAGVVFRSLRASPYVELRGTSPQFWLFHVERQPVPKPFVAPALPSPFPVPESARQGTIHILGAPTRATAGAPFTLHVQIANASPAAWPGEASTSTIPVRLAPYWRPVNAPGAGKINEGRAVIGRGVLPAQTVMVDVATSAPSVPGEYDLYVQVVQENVGWFPVVSSVRVTVTDDTMGS